MKDTITRFQLLAQQLNESGIYFRITRAEYDITGLAKGIMTGINPHASGKYLTAYSPDGFNPITLITHLETVFLTIDEFSRYTSRELSCSPFGLDVSLEKKIMTLYADNLTRTQRSRLKNIVKQVADSLCYELK